MAKPAAGATLDTGNALTTSLTHAWPLAEGSGTSSADAGPGADGLTLASAGLWSTDGSGDPVIAIGTAQAQPIALASPVVQDGSTSWTIAFRVKQAAADNQGAVIGSNLDASNFVRLYGGDSLDLRTGTGDTNTFTGAAGSTTTIATYVVSFTCTDPTNKRGTHAVYRDGTAMAVSPSLMDGSFTIDSIGNAYTGSGLALVGQVDLAYLWSGRALTQAEAATLSSDPYAIFATGPPPAATSYTLDGPASATGNVGSPSGAFAVTPDGAYTGTITPASTGSGSFSPTSLSFTGQASLTFTYTPTSTAGSPHAISTTASPALGTDPAPIDYTVTTAPLAAGTLSRSASTRTSITLAVGAPSGGSGTYTYTVYRADRADGTYAAISTPASITGATTYADSGLTWKSVYSYFIRYDDGTDAADSGFLDAAAMPMPGEVLGVALVGDSITEYVRDSLADFRAMLGDSAATAAVYDSVLAQSCDFVGSTTADWRSDAATASFNMDGVNYTGERPIDRAKLLIAASLADCDVKVASIALGTNDAVVPIAAEDYAANLQDICASLLEAVDVAVIQFPPAALRSGRTAAALGLLGVDYPVAIGPLEDGTTVFVGSRDTFAATANGYAAATAWTSDGVHPNATGIPAYLKLWADGITAALNRYNVVAPTPASVAAAVWAYADRTLTA